ncbi:MAG: glycosyl transferase [Bacteroidota bacterium]
MYNSLEKNCSNFHLYIFAFNDKAFEILTKLNLKHATIITLKDFETERLLNVKKERSRAEYCWTCTSSTILHVLNNYAVDNCTYVDADLYFYTSPQILFDEMEISNKSVLITEHRYTSKYDRTEIAGKYCVQFVTFKNNEEGKKVLNWWADACIDWCYDRYEDGKFGDQKYLDDWTTRFNSVHVLQHLGGGLAPWNIQQYEVIEQEKSKLTLKEISTNKKFDAVFYHFHYVRFYLGNLADLGWFKLTKSDVNNIYTPYIKELANALNIVQKIDPAFEESLRPFAISDFEGAREKLKYFVKKYLRYNLFNRNNL